MYPFFCNLQTTTLFQHAPHLYLGCLPPFKGEIQKTQEMRFYRNIYILFDDYINY